MIDQTNALVGAAIRTNREALGMSQSVLAAALGLSRTSVTNIEKGKQPISLYHLYLAAAALGLSAKDLLPDMLAPEPRYRRRSTEVTALLEKLETTSSITSS
ncbi:hypothetical protein Gbth_076_038 [Gluconobacter thailandicus F149-1 = NBRC 100600]|uniref:helix-turn-helix domain-containing protein n=1 Tax=Gluconobacter thailandicus TaxID=257438 RepID=UPI0005DE5640|nr:helix-turn-helix transcriptional regulator [Gluconobacter thailandicus]GAN94646.1 hypothetical protein Gbth_076_038 [Gluconobacter thailandicus F149-1 = NBRC 100600]GBR61314.1 hypothetical protein AA100600_2670 [Gluconobacter thailandicus F149-1 = NBRC 100600]GEL88101.1 hypothetical protein GTH01_24590 [Gluconobacter thailandicus F149-1 = NBRC 100600]